MTDGVRRVVVVGGGITGLAAAHSLCEANHTLTDHQPRFEVLLLESDDRLGGKICTTPFMGRPVDEGADVLLTRVPWALELIGKLDMEPTLYPAVGNAFVVGTRRRTEVRSLPPGLVMGVPTSLFGLLRSRVVGLKAVCRMALDLFRRDNWPGPDETVGELVSRRLGPEISAALVGPLLGSINAGDIDKLEAVSVAPILATAARQGSSLIRALRQQTAMDAKARGVRGLVSSVTGLVASTTGPVFASFESGLGALATKLTAAITAQGVQVRTGVTVRQIVPSGRTGCRLEVTTTQGEQIDADTVLVTTPTFVTQRLLGEAAPNTAALLARIEYASVAIATLGFDGAQIRHRLNGAGLLVPAREGMYTTACSFASSKWPHWADEGKVVLRVSVGRHRDTRALAMSDESLVNTVVGELSPLLGITGEPLNQRVSRWNNSLPQYARGHQSLVDDLSRSLAAELPGVFLAGAGYRGMGVPACIRQATEAATALL